MFVRSPKDLALIVLNQRKKLKISQGKTADKVGLRQTTISAFENKPESTKLETLFQILSSVNLEMRVLEKNKSDKLQSAWKEEW